MTADAISGKVLQADNKDPRHVFNKAAQISLDLPKQWVISDEQTLFEQGFIVAPEPLYSLVASPAPTPSTVVFAASSMPWLFVSVEADNDMLPAADLYTLAPTYLESLATESGNPVTKLKMIIPHHVLHQGGLAGSAAALTLSSPSGDTSINEVAFGKGDQLWMVIVGCSAVCFNGDQEQIRLIVASVRVGMAASP
jgi:hypothetical protein